MSGCRHIMRALGAPGLTHAEARLFAYYVGRANGAKVCWPGIAEISADLANMAQRTIKLCNHELQRKGRLKIVRRYKDSNHYFILDPDKWVYGEPPVASEEAASGAMLAHVPGADVAQVDTMSDASIAPTPDSEVQKSVFSGADIAPSEGSEVQKPAFLGAENAQQTSTQESIKEDKKVSKKARTPHSPPKGTNAAQEKSGKRAVAPLAADWQPDDRSLAYAIEHGVDASRARDEFCNYWLGEGVARADWQATFRNRVLALEERGRFRLADAKRLPYGGDPLCGMARI